MSYSTEEGTCFFFLDVDVLFFVLSRAWDKDLRISRSDAIPLSHRDSTVSDVYYEVHM